MSPVAQTPPSQTPSPDPHRELLDSWKEIAVYLNRSERTVRRWEATEGLPVHRHLHRKRGTVRAYKPEIDRWWQERGLQLEDKWEIESAANGNLKGHLLRAVRGRVAWATVVIVLALAGLIVTIKSFHKVTVRVIPRIDSLAVLPLRNLSSDPNQEYFADGMTEALITELAKIRELGSYRHRLCHRDFA